MGISFAVMAINYFFSVGIGELVYILVIVAGGLFIFAIAKTQRLNKTEKPVFILYVLVIIIILCARILHLNGSNEFSLIGLIAIMLNGGYVLYMKFITKSIEGKSVIIEIAGLFACAILPFMLPLLRSLLYS